MVMVAAVACLHPLRVLADDDHDQARQALERGEALPLGGILSEVRKAVPGEVVGIELEHEHGAWVYEIKVIQAGGMRAEVLVDARSGRIVSVKGK